jgi:CheY-like chemotaxis protein
MPPPVTFSGLALLVDDDEGVRFGVRMVLEVLGFDVVEVGDGLSAIAALEANLAKVTAVLLDWTLPGMTGAATYQALRGMRAELPILLCSGRQEPEALESTEDHRYTRFLLKPFGIDELSTALATLLNPS